MGLLDNMRGTPHFDLIMSLGTVMDMGKATLYIIYENLKLLLIFPLCYGLPRRFNLSRRAHTIVEDKADDSRAEKSD